MGRKILERIKLSIVCDHVRINYCNVIQYDYQCCVDIFVDVEYVSQIISDINQ